MVIGNDLDNTLATYDELLHRLAVERGIIKPSVETSKKAVRDTIRALPEGEVEWQKLQGLMYGPRMREASLSPDIKVFLQLCREQDAKIRIISHKTEFANYDDTQTYEVVNIIEPHALMSVTTDLVVNAIKVLWPSQDMCVNV